MAHKGPGEGESQAVQLGIRDKLALLSLLISLIALLVAGVVLHRTTMRELRAGIEQNLLNYSDFQYERVHAFIRQHSERFALMSSHPRLISLMRNSGQLGEQAFQDQLTALLEDARRISLQYQELALFADNGELLALTGDGWLPEGSEVVSTYAEAKEPVLGFCSVSGGYLGLCLGGAVLVDEKVAGVLLAITRLDSLHELVVPPVNMDMNIEVLLSRRLPNGQAMQIVPQALREQFEPGQTDAINPFRLAKSSGENRVLAIDDARGKPVLAVVSTFDKVGWGMTVKVDRQDALIALERNRETLIKLLFFLLVVAIGLSFWFANSLTRPISELTAMAMQIAGGDLKHRIQVKRGDEIGMLGLAFNQMADRLVEAKESLEERVRAKSAELMLLNRRLAEANENLERQVLRDRLTGIGNRRGFDRAIHEEWRRSQRDSSPLSLLFIDVDYFKGYNDTLGHSAGDKALRAIAQVLSEHARRPGDLAARYGGDEFVLLLPNLNSEQAKVLAGSIQESMRERNIPHPCSQASNRVTLSIGIATITPSEALLPAELVRAADEALYYAKAQGRNCWFVASLD